MMTSHQRFDSRNLLVLINNKGSQKGIVKHQWENFNHIKSVLKTNRKFYIILIIITIPDNKLGVLTFWDHSCSMA